MKGNDHIENELREVSPALVGLERGFLYAVPHGYFDTLCLSILDRVRTGESVNYSFTKQNAYTVPEGYFEGLAPAVVRKLNSAEKSVAKELNEVAPFLATIPKELPYEIPGGYFSKREGKTTNNSKGKVVSFGMLKRITRYAVAAVIVGLAGVGIYLFEKPVSPTPEAPYATVKKLSDEELSNYLKSSPVDDEQTTPSSTATSLIKYSDLKKSVKEIPDKELQEYVSEFGETEGI